MADQLLSDDEFLVSDDEFLGSGSNLVSDDEFLSDKPAPAPVFRPSTPAPNRSGIPMPAGPKPLQAEIPASRDANDVRPPSREEAFANESLGDTAKRRGQQVAAGATEAFAAVPEGMALLGVQADQSKREGALAGIKERETAIAELEARLKDPSLRQSERTFLESTLADLREGIARLQEQAAEPIVPARERELYKAGDKVREASQGVFGKPDPRDQAFWGKVAYGAGNVIGMGGTAVAAGLVGGPAGAFIVGGAQGATMNSSQIYKEAIEAGADEQTALAASNLGLAVGMTEIIPLSRALKIAGGDKVVNTLLRKAIEVGKNAGEEGLQEFVAQVANNMIAQGYYDPQRGVFQGAGEAALIGMILGGATSTVGAVASGSKREEEPQKPTVTTGETEPDTEAALKGGGNAAPPAAQPTAEVAPDAKVALDANVNTTAPKSIDDMVDQVMKPKPAPAAPVTQPGNAPANAAPAAPVTETPATGPEAAGDTVETVPEAPATIQTQNEALLDPKNKRKAVFIPFSSYEAGEVNEPEGKTIGRVVLPDAGILFFNKAKGYTAADIRALYKAGKLGQVLGLGEITKADAAKSAAQGNAPVAVTERTPQGTEVKAAAGTTETAPDQQAALEAEKTPGNTVQVESPAKVMADRLAGRQTDAAPAAPQATEQVAQPTEQVASAPTQAGTLADVLAGRQTAAPETPAKPEPVTPAAPTGAERARAVRENAVRALAPQLETLGFTVDQVLAMPEAQQRRTIEKAKLAAKPADAPKAAPKAQVVKDVAKKREEAAKPEAKPEAKAEVQPEVTEVVTPEGKIARTTRDPKTGKATTVITDPEVEKAKEEFDREQSEKYLAEKKAREQAERKAKSEERRKAAAEEIQRKKAEGELKTAEEEAKARIASGNSKDNTRNDAKVEDAKEAAELMAEFVPAEVQVVVSDGQYAQLQKAVEEAERANKMARAKRAREELNRSVTKAMVLDRLRRILDAAKERGIKIYGKTGDTTPDALMWLSDVKMMKGKLENEKVPLSEVQDWLSEEAMTARGDSSAMRERRRLMGDLISNQNKSAGGDVENMAGETSLENIEQVTDEEGNTEVVEGPQAEEAAEDTVTADDLETGATLGRDDQDIGARATRTSRGPVRTAGRNLYDRIKELKAQLGPILERDNLTVEDLVEAVPNEPGKVEKYLDEAAKATVRRIDPNSLTKEDLDRLLGRKPAEPAAAVETLPQPKKDEAPKAAKAKAVAKKRADAPKQEVTREVTAPAEPAPMKTGTLEEAAPTWRTGRDAAEWLADNSSNPSYRIIAARILPALQNSLFYVAKTGDVVKAMIANSLNFSAKGVYYRDLDSGERAIVIRSDKLDEEVTLHELVHSAADDKLEQGLRKANENTPLGKAANDFVDLWRLVLNEYKARAKANPNDPLLNHFQVKAAVTDARELMTYGLTNPTVQGFLKTVTVPGNKANAFTQFVTVVRRLLGIQPEQNDALTKLLELSDRVFDQADPMQTRPVMDITGATKAPPLPKNVPTKEAPKQRLMPASFKTGQGFVADVLHGTVSDIQAWSKAKLGLATEAKSAEQGFFFAASPATANVYTGGFKYQEGLRKQFAEVFGKFLRGETLTSGEQDMLAEANRNSVELGTTDKIAKVVATVQERGASMSPGQIAKQADYIATLAVPDKKPNVQMARIKMDNPYVHDFGGDKNRAQSYAEIMEKAKAAGHDGVVFLGTFDGSTEPDNIFAVFEPEQISQTYRMRDPEVAFPMLDGNPEGNQRVSRMDDEGYATMAELEEGAESASTNPDVEDARALLDQLGTFYHDRDNLTPEMQAAIMGKLGTDSPERHFAEGESTVAEEARLMGDSDIRRGVLYDYALTLFGKTYNTSQRELLFKTADRVQKQLAELAGDVKIYWLSEEDMTRFDPYASAYYSPKGDYIVARASLLDSPSRWAHVIPHETAHAALWHAIRSKPVLNKQINALRAKVAKWALRNGMGEDIYGLKNVDEFMSEALSNPEFQQMLARVQLSGIDLALLGVRPQVRGRIKTALEWLRVAVAKSLGLDVDTPSALNVAMQFGEKLMADAVKARAAYYARNPGFASIAPAILRSEQVTPKGNDSNKAKGKREPGIARRMKMRGLNDRQAARVAQIIKERYDNKATDEQLDEIAALIRGEGDAAERAAKVAKAEATRAEAAMKRLGREVDAAIEEEFVPGKNPGRPWLLWAKTSTAIARIGDRFFGENNPLREVAGTIQRRDRIRDQYRQDMMHAVRDLLAIKGKFPRKVVDDFFELIHDVTMAGVHPDVGLDHEKNAHLGKDALKGMYGKGAHPELKARYDALPQELKDLYAKTRDTLTDAQNQMTYGLMRNTLSALGFNDEAMVRRFHEGRATETDYAMVGEEAAQHLINATAMRKVEGPYFNLVRRGDHVVRGFYKITPPGNATVLEPNVFEFKSRKEAIAYVQKMAQTEKLKSSIQSVWVDKNTGNVTAIDVDGKEVKISPKDVDAENRFRVTVQNEHVEFVDGRREALRRNKALKAAGLEMYDVEAKDWERDAQNAQMLSDQFRALAATIDKRDSTSKLTAAQKAELKGLMNEVSLRFLGATRIQSSRLPRRYVQGASRDIARNTYDYVRETAGYLAKLDTEPQMEAAIKDMDDRLKSLSSKGTGAGEGARLLVNELKERALDPNYGQGKDSMLRAIGDRLLLLSFLRHLVSPAYSFVNMLGGSFMTFSHLAGDFNPFTANYQMLKAYKDMGVVGTTLRGVGNTLVAVTGKDMSEVDFVSRIKSRLKGRELELIERLDAENLLGSGAAMDLDRVFDKSNNIVGRSFDAVTGYVENIGRVMPQAVEAVNRTMTALAAYRMQFAKTKDHEKSIRYALDAVDKTQGNYAASNAPPVFNAPFLRVALQFKKYPQLVYTFLLENVARTLRPMNKGDRRKGIMSLLYTAGTMQIFAGTVGLPFLEVPKLIITLLAAAGLDDDDWEDWKKWYEKLIADMTGSEKASEMVTYGVTRGLGDWGFDLSTRVGMGDMLTYGEPRSGKEADVKTWLFDLLGGPAVGYAGDLASGMADVIDGDVAKGVNKIVPMKVLADLGKAMQGGSRGTMSEEDAVLRVLGLTSASQARQNTEKWRGIKEKQESRAVVGELIGDLLSARTTEEIREAVRAIEKHNAKLEKDDPSRITGLKSLLARRQAEAAKERRAANQ